MRQPRRYIPRQAGIRKHSTSPAVGPAPNGLQADDVWAGEPVPIIPKSDHFITNHIPQHSMGSDDLRDDGYLTYSPDGDNTVPVRTDSETHIGVEKKSGGWLENETDKILRFAGFKTQRERKVVFEESTDEHYRVDILAQYESLTLFVECKDYTEIKVNEKILFALIGQIHDYRRGHPDETVVGVLVTSAKNIGQNMGIQNKLLREGCQLWDGNTIQKFQDKMIEMEQKSEFTQYLLEKLGYVTSPTKTQDLLPGQHKFYSRISFFSIPALAYVGDKFSHQSIINDLKEALSGTNIEISSMNYKQVNSAEGERLNFIIDFEMSSSDVVMDKHWKNQSRWLRRPRETPLELTEINFEQACKNALIKTYGVEIDDLASYPINCIATRTR